MTTEKRDTLTNFISPQPSIAFTISTVVIQNTKQRGNYSCPRFCFLLEFDYHTTQYVIIDSEVESQTEFEKLVDLDNPNSILDFILPQLYIDTRDYILAQLENLEFDDEAILINDKFFFHNDLDLSKYE